MASAAALAVAAAFLAGAVWYNRSLGSQAELGRPVPAFRLADLRNRPVETPALAGRPYVINFWTTWCEPCREEIPSLEAFYRRFGDRMPIVGVNVREPAGTVERFVQEFAMTYPVVRDVDGKVAERFRVRGYPESWLVGADGVARRYWPGPLTFETLEQAYREVTGQPIAAGSARGGPLPAGDAAVAAVSAGRYLFLVTSGRILQGEVRRWDRPETWRALPLPEGAGGARPVVTAATAASGQEGLVVALDRETGHEVWAYDPGAARWSRRAIAPGRVLSLSPLPGGNYLAWVEGQGLVAVDGAGRSSPLVSQELPLPARQAHAVVVGEWVVAATPVGVLRAPAGDGGVPLAGGAIRFSPTRLAEPARWVMPWGREWLVATQAGLYRYDPRDDQAAPLPGTPVRAFAALAPLPGGRVAAVAADGDLYQVDPAAPAGGWQLSPIARGVP